MGKDKKNPGEELTAELHEKFPSTFKKRWREFVYFVKFTGAIVLAGAVITFGVIAVLGCFEPLTWFERAKLAVPGISALFIGVPPLWKTVIKGMS